VEAFRRDDEVGSKQENDQEVVSLQDRHAIMIVSGSFLERREAINAEDLNRRGGQGEATVQPYSCSIKSHIMSVRVWSKER